MGEGEAVHRNVVSLHLHDQDSEAMELLWNYISLQFFISVNEKALMI